jgi:hypothetical protein
MSEKTSTSNSMVSSSLPSLAFIFMLSFLILGACSRSGKKAYERGKYYDAVVQSVDRLRSNPNHKTANQILPRAYKSARQDELRNIERATTANQRFKHERIFQSYFILNEMHDMIEKCPACRNLVEPESFYTQMEKARHTAAEERYLAGVDELKKNTKIAGRAAFDHFIIVDQISPGFQNIQNKIDEALFMASVHVVVEQPKLNSRLFNYSYEYFQDQILEFLSTNRRMNEFIRFYTPDEADMSKLVPDHIVRLEFVDFVVGETLLESHKERVSSADSVKTGTATIGDKQVDVYDRVHADIMKFRRFVRSHGILEMTIIDYQSGKRLRRDEMAGEYIWGHEWATFNGDERALSNELKELCKNRELMPPPAQQLFLEFTKPIFGQFTNNIRRFYTDW